MVFPFGEGLGISRGPKSRLSEFRCPSKYTAVDTSRCICMHQHLSWTLFSLQHMSDLKVYWSGRIPLLPSFRLQGLLTLLTIYSLQILAGYFTFPQHSWDSPFGVQLFTRQSGLTAFFNPHAVSLEPDTQESLPGTETLEPATGSYPRKKLLYLNHLAVT